MQPISNCASCMNWKPLKSNPLLGECSSSEDLIWGETKYAFVEDCRFYKPFPLLGECEPRKEE